MNAKLTVLYLLTVGFMHNMHAADSQAKIDIAEIEAEIEKKYAERDWPAAYDGPDRWDVGYEKKAWENANDWFGVAREIREVILKKVNKEDVEGLERYLKSIKSWKNVHKKVQSAFEEG